MNVADELSIQLYSMREYGDLDKQLTALGEIGFKRVELVGSHLQNAKDVRAKLDAHGMTAPTGHVTMADLRDRLDWAVDQANIIGIVELYMPAVPQDERDAPADAWRKVGEELGGMAEEVEARGLKLGYHNHHWELKPFADGTTPLQHFFEGAEGSPLTFEADLAWLVRGNADPVEWMEKEKARLTAVHVKDIAPEGQNLDEDGWADIGAGIMDWPSLWRKSLELGAKWMILEHDKPKDPVAFARNSRAFLLEQLS
ncbi:MAG TPA: sugar phosphate isomerase/epimerase [Hyphomicrobiales bacterium]|nr:sugar phosphate isomerase/epimerase [Hyphomicrobiales bacterium]